MGAKPTTIGGGKSTGVANDFASQLQSWLSQGFGSVPGSQQTAGDNLNRANPTGQVSNLSQAFAALLNNGGGQDITKQATQLSDIRRKNDVADLRSRYSMGGTGYGTPASSGEANFLASYDPATTMNIAQLNQQGQQFRMDGISRALAMLMPMFQQQAGLGTPQAQTVMKPSFGAQLISGLGSVAKVAAPFFGGGLGGAAASMMGSGGGIPAAPQMGNLAQQAGYAPSFDMNNMMTPAPSLNWDPRLLAGIPSFAGSYRG